jgi:hypothetical protein
MELLTVVFGGVLLALFTAIQTWINRGRFDALERRFELLTGEIAALRSDLLQVALAATPRPHPQTG